MPLETATYIPDLVVTNPANSDGLNQADDHMRLIKSAVKATFPNFTSAALSSTQAQIDAVVAQTVSAIQPGFVMDFAGTAVPTGWLECNGAAVSRTTYAALFAKIGTAWGAGDGSTTFNLPPDRYRVGKNTAAVAVGTLQASQNKSHTHTGSGTTGAADTDHTHTQTGTFTSGASNQSLNHSHSVNPQGGTIMTAGAGGTLLGGLVGGSGVFQSSVTTGAIDLTGHAHNVTISGQTGSMSAQHAHSFSFTTSAGSADGTDARPLTAVYLTCIKT
jgi:microcystin-dependent protein